jgi:cell division septal protein FtsQ
MRTKYRKPYRVKRKKSILKSRFFWLILIILFFFGAVFYLLIFSSYFQVEKILISGNEKVPKEVIESLIRDNLKRKILFLPTQSIFVIDFKKINEIILNNIPGIAEVKTVREFPNILNITVKERVGIALWCQEENYCFLIDKEGVIFEPILEELKLEKNLPKIIDRKNNSLTIDNLGKKIVIEKDYLEKIFKIQKYIQEEIKIEIEEFIAFSQHLNVKTVEGWEIYFNPSEDINWQLTKLKLVLEEKIPPEKRKDLEYIELRFGDLATFRYR